MEHEIVITDLIKGVFEKRYHNCRNRRYLVAPLIETKYGDYLEGNPIPKEKQVPLKDEEEVYIDHYNLKEVGLFEGEVLTPSQLRQIVDYIWRVIPIG